MKWLAAITAFVGGLLLILVPRFILPACEYLGHPHMRCSDTAQAEMIAGGVLMLIGSGLFVFNKKVPLLSGVVGACLVYGVSIWLPDRFGYCLNPQMPCHYGMVPGVRFIATIGGLVMIAALIGIARSDRTKGNA